MNRIPQHKASQYSEYGVVLHRFSSQGINHTPVSYAHQDDYYVFGLLTKGTACGIIDFKELHLKEGDVFLVQPGQVHRFVSSQDVEGWLMMAEHLSTHRQPSYYASLLNISTVYLNEVVKKVTGMSTALYIKGEVVLQAKRLLVHTHLSVKQIADKLGFDDYAYFSRLFMQATGISPTEFRRKNLD